MTNKEAIFVLKKELDGIPSDIDKSAFEKAVNLAIKALERSEWIPVSERLPEERTSVLIWCPERKNIYCAYLEENQWWIFGAYFEKVIKN